MTENPPAPTLRFTDRPYLAWGVLALVTFLGTWWRLAGIGESLWLDELHTAWTISGNLADVPQRAAWGNYSPAYFFVTGAFVKVLGMTEFALRFPSLCSGVALIPLAYAAIVVWTRSRVAGLLAAWLIAADGTFLLFAQEARPYAIIQLLGLIHVLVFWSMLQNPTWGRRALWIAIGVALFFLHYTALLLVVAEFVAFGFLVLCGKNRPRYRAVPFMLDLGLMLLACSPAGFHLMEIAERRDNWKAFVPQRPASEVFTGFPFPLVVYVYLPAGLAILAALFRRIVRLVPAMMKFDWRLIVVLGCWFLVPVGAAWLVTHLDVARLLYPRYVIAASLAPILAAALACSSGGDRWTRLALAFAVAATVVVADRVRLHSVQVQPCLMWHPYTTRGAENWRDAVRYLNARPDGREQPVFVQSCLIEADALEKGGDATLADYCLFPVASAVYPLDTEGRPIWPLRSSRRLVPDPQSLDSAAELGGAWLIVRGPGQWADKTLHRFAQAAAAHGLSVGLADRKYLQGVQIYRVTVARR